MSEAPILLRGLARPHRLLFCVRHRRLAHPRAVFPGLDSRAQPVAVARSVALDDAIKLVEVDRSEVVVTALPVPFELRVGHRDAEILGLRHGLVDETLP